MSSKSEKPKAKTEEKLLPFLYPSIGDGVTIMAKDQQDADKKAAKLMEDMNSTSSPSKP